MEQSRTGNGEEPETEGEKYLRLLGLSDIADRKITTRTGESFEARDFLDICGVHARPMLIGFESMSHDDPKYGSTLAALRGVVLEYIETPPA